MSSGDRSRRTDGTVVVIGAGQSGLAAAHALLERNVATVVLEARDRAAGSWPYYYDSLQAFSPAGFNSMPEMSFPGDPDRYPARDEVADYLERYAAGLGVEIRTNTPVTTVSRAGSHRITMRVTGDRGTGRLLGMQLFGHKNAEIAKRVDIAATAIFHRMTVDAVSDLDLSYTPPLGSPWEAVQMGTQAWIRATRRR